MPSSRLAQTALTLRRYFQPSSIFGSRLTLRIPRHNICIQRQNALQVCHQEAPGTPLKSAASVTRFTRSTAAVMAAQQVASK
ncbi:hypothetical protein CY34DRAFT_800473 [Suillus luteus UH-Slu-Lm8-n1]|uniref:Uncharacterized protein n=1 Tax=Suillus luteus UH-Slu-Lm8-n1 TaxID=930992 RepID=A0A0D0BTU4_9AGAM|nr:hypothetical protein CY34DRAFT_800473 [Suillus luteus UH-Slu-Lm8-n1]